MLEYRDYIWEVYQQKSFSKAARKLYVSQPWLSSVVKKVEKEVQQPLFDRSTNPISLTEAGEYYMKKIEQVRLIEDEMKKHFADLHAQSGVSLKIGSSMFFCTYVLPQLLSDFCGEYPESVITFTEGVTAELHNQLEKGRLDFVMEVEKPQSKGLESRILAREELILAVPSSYELPEEVACSAYTFDEFLHRNESPLNKPAVNLSSFRDFSFIMLAEGNDSNRRGLDLCRNAGFTPKVSMYLTQMMTAYYLVCEGQGISLLRSTIPEHVTPNGHVNFFLLDDDLAQRNIYISYRQGKLKPIHRELIDYICSGDLQ